MGWIRRDVRSHDAVERCTIYRAHQPRPYAFDEIGNRTQTQRDQDRPTTWTANDLNQYTARQVSSNLHVFGRAVTSRTVSVEANGGAMTAAVTRLGAYFHGALTVTNTFAPVWADILVRAIATNGLAETNNFQRLVERTPEAFAHDADGNLVEDGRWAYSWDAENRLTQAVARAAAPNLKLVFAYDHMSRRIAKTVSVGTNDAWTQTSSRAFIYDGWNLAAETGGVYGLQTYAWGLDLSGTHQGAGGVGGLLGSTLATTNGYVVGCDANGNVMLAVLDNGTLQSQMEYGPFAEALRFTEYAAPGANPFRFSTKYEDAETGLLYYGYRYYIPAVGRWLSRDPVKEKGGINLYCAMGNDLVDENDPIGLAYGCGNRVCGPQGPVGPSVPYFPPWDVHPPAYDPAEGGLSYCEGARYGIFGPDDPMNPLRRPDMIVPFSAYDQGWDFEFDPCAYGEGAHAIGTNRVVQTTSLGTFFTIAGPGQINVRMRGTLNVVKLPCHMPVRS